LLVFGIARIYLLLVIQDAFLYLGGLFSTFSRALLSSSRLAGTTTASSPKVFLDTRAANPEMMND
jgi:hypothetical protein